VGLVAGALVVTLQVYAAWETMGDLYRWIGL